MLNSSTRHIHGGKPRLSLLTVEILDHAFASPVYAAGREPGPAAAGWPSVDR
jgi:hypothetical protein